MPRIRTIKPEFFRDEQLQDLERDHPALRPMLVFAGLWGHCDANGVFPWAPRQLALDLLPFLWEGSIGEALGKCLVLLWRFHFVSRFEADGKTWGLVPGFKRHQRISGKELQGESKYPNPEDFEQEKHPGSNGEAPGKHPESQEVEVEVEVEGKGNGAAKNPPTRKRAAPFTPPEWVPRSEWDAWVEMRKKKRNPPTVRACELAVVALEDLKAHGEDPAAVLNQSTFKGWQGLFPVKNNGQGPRSRDDPDHVMSAREIAEMAEEWGRQERGEA